MRIFLIFIFFFSVVLNLSGQDILNKRIDYKVEDTPIKDALFQLGELSDISISFSGDIFKDDIPISVYLEDVSIKKILENLIANYPVQYKISGNNIILYPRIPRKRTISGYVEDRDSGEKLIGAYVVDYKNGKGTTTNEYGFYNLTLWEGENQIQVSYVGYEDKIKGINLKGNRRFHFKLKPSNSLKEVVVVASTLDSLQSKDIHGNTSDIPTRKQDLASNELGAAASLGGESDILQVAYLSPGVHTGVGGFGGMHVRGGHEDQNLILMDGVTVYNHSHALGVVSIFNSSAINQTSLIKGGFSARYGGRLSSILDVRTKEGNLNQFQGDLLLGTFASRLSFQGPFKKRKAGFFLSVRRTHLDPIIKTISRLVRESENSSGFTNYEFFDVNAKVHWKISGKDKIFYSFYMGGDRYKNENSESEFLVTNVNGQEDVLINSFNSQNQRLKWGNNIQSIRWNHLFLPKLFLNSTLVYSTYNYTNFQGTEANITKVSDNEILDFTNSFTNLTNDIQDIGLRMDFDLAYNSHHYLKFGMAYNHKIYAPGIITLEDTTVPSDSIPEQFRDSTVIDPLSSREFIVYAQNNMSVDDLSVDLGVYTSIFSSGSGTYVSIEPRLNVNYLVTPKLNLNLTATRMSQNIHLLSNEGISLPNDLWVPATKKAKPQYAWQTSLGLNWQIDKNVSLSVEGYYKRLKNVIAYKARIENPQVSNIVVTDWESEIIQGNGNSMGLETMLQKKNGGTRGRISYTLSKATRKFDDLNDGIKFPYSYDRKHLVQAIIRQRISRKVDVSANWTYGTGRPITLISTSILSFFQDSDTEIIGNFNGHRLPDYHQLNIGFDFNFRKKWGGQTLSLGLYNAYNQQNAFFQYFEKFNGLTSDRLTSLTFLPIFPTFSYGIYFE